MSFGRFEHSESDWGSQTDRRSDVGETGYEQAGLGGARLGGAGLGGGDSVGKTE